MNLCFRTRGVLAGVLVSLFLCASAATSATLIPTNSTWKYLANGVGLGSSWRFVGYNDFSWLSGAAQLGYGDNDETTVIGSTNGTNSARPVTTYFRRTIVIPSQVTDATLRLMRDDGAVVYINGVEVFRDNMPTGAVNVTTLALLAIGGADESAFLESAVPPSVFVTGTNVIAVEIHQNSVLSSDMSFALALEANLGPPGPNVTVEAIVPETREQSPLVDIPLIPAVFRISRTGPTDNALGVGFSLGGTASNGIDYEFVSNSISIPAGASNATVEIIAIDDLLVEGTESVVLTLIPTPCLECYVVGSPASATASILDNDLPPPGTNITLVSAGSTWRYLDNGTDLGTAWRAPAFNDDTWAQGPAQLGFGDGDEQYIISPGSNGLSHITYYFRRPFEVTGAAGLSNAVVRLLRDDGGVVYLNGVEVFRSNMPTGTVSYTTLALSSVCCGDESTNFYPAAIDASLFVEGKNVLAVEIHQNAATSGDLSFDLSLTAGGSVPPPLEKTIVEVLPADSEAAEPFNGVINTGQFAIRRTGNLGASIPVRFVIGGSADNGTDYAFISNSLVIPAGSTQVVVTVTPFADNIIEGTDVVSLTLLSAICLPVFPPPPACYEIGNSNSAVVFIADSPGVTNQPPYVSWVTPTNGSIFNQGSTILLRASASDADGVARVEFYRDTSFIGSSSAPGGTNSIYTVPWSNAPAGNHTLSAVAVDTLNARGTSAPINIVVNGIVETNVFPTVRVFASDNSATEETADIGRFNITRTGPISNALPIFYALSGTANHELDYSLGTNSIVIPPFATNVSVSVIAVDDAEADSGETVVLTIVLPPPSLPTPPYNVGSPSNATVFIYDNDSNAPPSTLTLISTGSVWNFLDNGSDQGTVWRGVAFDDASWAMGPAQLGYGDGDEATVINGGPINNRFITTYFRRAFEVSNPGSLSNLNLRLLRDDGGVVYLNGVEVFRSNMPTGEVNYLTLTPLIAEEPSLFHPSPIDASLLINGKNVIAVEIHQNAVISSDVSFDLELTANGPIQPNERTVVQVLPADSQATEPANGLIDVGQFAIRRTGNLGTSIPVGFLLGGSASNGVDYAFISNTVVIPAGSTQVMVTVTPLADNLVEGTDLVILSLLTPVCPAVFPPPPECYEIGNSNAALVFIADAPGGTNQNQPPLVSWLLPTNGSVFTQGSLILLRASASDADGVARVEFYRGGSFIGSTSNVLGTNSLYIFGWSNAPVGNHTLTAVAVDTLNARGTSSPVNIVVTGAGETNVFSTVRVFATDNSATEETGDTGQFTFIRSGAPISNSLPIFFTLSGSASQGVDYSLSTNSVVIPPFATNVSVTVTAINDGQADNGEAVVLTVIRPPPSISTPPYEIGTPSNATVFIYDNDFNLPPTNLTLIATGSVWKYLDNGSDQGTGWQSIPFADEGWLMGPAQLGYGDGDEATVINGGTPTNRVITTYFRRAFEIGNPGSISNLVVRLLRDDGGIVYLNGIEVFRSNMPTGAVNYLTLASIVAEEPSLFHPSPIDTGLLVTGRNVIAVEIHQNAATSSDVSFDLELTADGALQPGERTVVSVVALDAQGAEPSTNGFNNIGIFAFRRTGNLGSAIPVNVVFSGTALNGTDYSFVTNPIIIPAGATQALVNIVPLADNLVEGTETVTVSMVPPPCAADLLPPECFEIGSPAQATVNILDGPSNSNRSPVAFWLTPTNGSMFALGSSVLLSASANDLDGSIARVEFRRGSNLVGTAVGPGTNYTFFWTNPPLGSQTLFAVAVDNLNARGTSAPVTITILGTTNPLPTVTITRPVDGAILPRADVLIEAVTQDANGYADTVEFFADSQKIGESQILFIQAPPPGSPIHFELTWTNPPAGEHVLEARTTDNNGARGTSAPVHITIQGGAVVVYPAPRDQKEPSVAANGEIYFVVWADQREFNDTEWDIYGARITREGEVLDPNGIRICRQLGIQNYPSVASDGRDFLVVWNDGRSGDYDIYGARVTAEGTVRETNGFLISDAYSSQFYPSLAFNGTNYLVAWYDYRSSINLPSNDIYGARVSRFGNVLDPQGIPICTAENQQWAPGVASLGGNFFVAWDDSRYPNQSVRGTRVTGAGTPINPDGNVISPHFSGYPIRVAANASNFLTVWTDSRNYETTQYDIFAHRISPGGLPIESDLVLSSAADMQVGPAVASGGGEFFAVWMDDRFGYTNSRIFGTRIGANGVLNPAGIEIGRLASSAAWNSPSIASLSNQYLVAWVGGRDENGLTDIVAVRLNFNGERIGETFLVSTVVSNAVPTDSDGDGVPNDRDQCPNTLPNTVVNEFGCSISQPCPCDGTWQNHNHYVQCVRDTSLAFVNTGLITPAQREEIVDVARSSTCGRRHPRLIVPNQEMSNILLNGARMFLEGDGPVTCVIECSNDLNQWRPISTNLLDGVTIEIRDVDPFQGPRRFYRVREQ